MDCMRRAVSNRTIFLVILLVLVIAWIGTALFGFIIVG